MPWRLYLLFQAETKNKYDFDTFNLFLSTT